MKHQLALTKHKIKTISYSSCAALVIFFAAPLHAYIGPGAGVTSVGLALAFVGLLLLLIIGFVWYPIKAIFFRKKPSANTDKTENPNSDKARDF